MRDIATTWPRYCKSPLHLVASEITFAISPRIDSSKIRFRVKTNLSSTAVGVAGQVLGCQAKNIGGCGAAPIRAPVIGGAERSSFGERSSLYFIGRARLVPVNLLPAPKCKFATFQDILGGLLCFLPIHGTALKDGSVVATSLHRKQKFRVTKHGDICAVCDKKYLTTLLYRSQIADHTTENKCIIQVVFRLVDDQRKIRF